MIHRRHYLVFRVTIADYHDKLDEPLEFGTFLEGIRDRENGHMPFKRFAFREYFLRLGR